MSKFKVVNDDTIAFESEWRYWIDEQSGIKQNTIRNRSAQEILDNNVSLYDGTLKINGRIIEQIQITEVDSRMEFTRTLTNVSVYKDTLIFTWNV